MGRLRSWPFVAAIVLSFAASAPFVASVRPPSAAAQDAPPAPPDDKPPAPAFKPPSVLALRRKPSKEKGADAAVAAGLDWLRRHHGRSEKDAALGADGRWDCDEFTGRCVGEACRGPGEAVFDPGVTGLATLAFLGAGRTHTEGEDAALVGASLKYLGDIQDSEGCFGPRTSARYFYNHAAAATAVAEALWLTGDEALRGPAQKGCNFLHASQNPYLAWRYGVRDGDNDTSSTVWAALAVRTCEFAGLDIDRSAYLGVRDWFDKMSDVEGGRVGYQQRGGLDARAWIPAGAPAKPAPKPPAPVPKGGIAPKDLIPLVGSGFQSRERTQASFGFVAYGPEELWERYTDQKWSSLTAGAAAVTTLTGGAESAKEVDRWAAFVAGDPPAFWRAEFLDLHYLWFGSLFHAQRPFTEKPPTDPAERRKWRSWREVAVGDLVEKQRAKTAACAAGSWDPELDPFGFAGGRVYSTSMALLALEAPSRFPRVWNARTKLLPPRRK